MSGRKGWLAAIGGACLTVAPTSEATAPSRPRHSSALWRVVHDFCVNDARLTGLPAPCLAVNLRVGYAVVKDLGAHTQVLLVPTVRLSGIEASKLQSPGSPNYWQAAWTARRYIGREVGVPVAREDVGMAINSAYGRSQDQLHIHVDCVRPDVSATLAAHAGAVDEHWKLFRWDLAGERYRARRVEGEDLGDHDPFKLLASGDPDARADMRRQTLAVIGFTFSGGRPGFILLAAAGGTAANPEGASESLLDHSCAILGGVAEP